MPRLRTLVVSFAVSALAIGAAAAPASADGLLLPQTIDFAGPNGGPVGTTEQLMATASSGLTVTFTSDTTDVCSVATGSDVVSYDHVGVCMVTASQDGDAVVYQAADPVTRSADVTQGTATIDFTQPDGGAVGTTEPLTATDSADLPVVFSVDPTTDNFGAVRQACSIADGSSTVHYDHTGSCVIDATQDATDDYASASATSDPITVVKADQTVTTLTDPSDRQLVSIVGYSIPGDVTSTSGLIPLFTVDGTTTNAGTSDAACTVGELDTSVTIMAVHAGECVVNVTQPGNLDYNAAPPQQISFTVLKGDQAADTNGFEAADASVGGTFELGSTTDHGQDVTWSAGSGTTACTVSGTTVTFVHAGSCSVDAAAPSTADYNEVQQTFAVTVGKGASAIAVHTTGSALGADVAQAKGTGAVVDGTKVTFTVDGTPVGSPVTVTNGHAHLDYHVPTGATRQVTATYAGSSDLTTSSGSYVRRDPKISVALKSATAKTRFGWYRTPVTASFTCTPGSTGFVKACPGAQSLSYNGTQRRVFGRVDAVDGGAAAVLTHVNIDHTAPTIAVSGPADGAVYVGTAPRAKCVATDALSGIAHCVLRVVPRANGVFSYAATSVDKAGNSAHTSGSYRVQNRYIRGAIFDGTTNSYLVQAGTSVTLVALAPTRPQYLLPAPGNTTPSVAGHTFFHDGRQANSPRWSLTVTLPTTLRSHEFWNLGVKVGSTVYKIRIRVTG